MSLFDAKTQDRKIVYTGTPPTDTNQASELYELCKEVYNRTKWRDTDYIIEENVNGEGYITTEFYRKSEAYVAPLYTSDYLLGKLPKNSDEGYPLTMSCIEEWRFYYWGDVIIEGKSDTPLLALLKLCLALKEAGEL